MHILANSATQGICTAALLAAASLACAQPASRAPSDAVRRSTLARTLQDSVGQLLADAVRDRAFPGAYAIIGDSRGVLAEHGDGRLDWDPAAPRPTRTTIWDLASLTKILATTTALAQLVERGAVELDAPVFRYLPEWRGGGRDAVTVRHLLTHTAGLPAFRPYDRDTQRPDSLATLIFWTPLERSPGERMVYSDIGAYVLGSIVERVSGDSLHVYVQRHVTAPLGLRETLFRPPRALRPRIAPTEIDSLRGGLVHGAVHDERAYYLGGVAAHAGLFGSARDLARFATLMLRGGTLDGVRLLQPRTIAAFTAYADSTFSNRALGWQKRNHPAAGDTATGAGWASPLMSTRAYGHTGFTGTSLAIDPDLDLYVILLSNRVNPTRSNTKISAVRRRLADAAAAVVRQHRGSNLNAGDP